jgi:hypothetical protein
MLTISVCYSNRSGQEFASCTLGGVELGAELLDQPAVLASAIRRAYDRCREAVDAQLTAAAPPAELALDRRLAELAATAVPAPAPPSPPAVAPAPNGRTFYHGGNGNGKGKDGPPTTGRQLGAVAKKLGALGFFEALGAAQNPPLPRFLGDWPDNMACWAWTAYQAACIPPQAVPSTNGAAY